MQKLKQLVQTTWRNFMRDSLYRNSVYLMGSTAAIAGFGLLFWVFAAHFYTTKDVGLVATLVSISNVVMTLSLLGFDNSFIRFLPKSKKLNEQINTGFVTSTLATIVVSIAYMVAIRLFVPNLSFVNSSLLWMSFFLFFMCVNTLNFLSNYPFIALRTTHIVLIINIGYGILRLALVALLSRYGFNGLIASHVVATFLALFITVAFMWRRMQYRPVLKIFKEELRRMGRYAFHSYFSILFLTLPTFILPTVVVGVLGPSSAAYYYVVAMTITALNVIPMATSQSLFAEGVWNGAEFKQHIIKAIKIISLLMVPAVLVLVALGHWILGIFGQDYATQGYGLLVLMAIAGIPKILSYLLSTVLRVEQRVGSVAIVYGVYALIVLAGSYWGVHQGHGLISIGWATLVAEIVCAALFGFVYKTRSALLSNPV